MFYYLLLVFFTLVFLRTKSKLKMKSIKIKFENYFALFPSFLGKSGNF